MLIVGSFSPQYEIRESRTRKALRGISGLYDKSRASFPRSLVECVCGAHRSLTWSLARVSECIKLGGNSEQAGREGLAKLNSPNRFRSQFFSLSSLFPLFPHLDSFYFLQRRQPPSLSHTKLEECLHPRHPRQTISLQCRTRNRMDNSQTLNTTLSWKVVLPWDGRSL